MTASVALMRPDGRTRRSDETRRRIVEAAQAIVFETGMAPTVVAVARRSGVSIRSVFQHFGDVESLFITVFDRVKGGVECTPLADAGEPLAHRLEALLEALATAFDEIVPLRQAAGQIGPDNGALAERTQAARAQVRRLVESALGFELAQRAEADRAETASALAAALSWDGWIELRRGQGLSREAALGVWRRTASALLQHPRAP